jgi:predicted short-subunit dehydrogenase-like oxidoreductase (DUF2520 family)
VGSLHPLVSVSEPVVGSAAFAGAYFCVEGNRTALKLARTLVKDLQGRSFSIAAPDKALYHAAAVMSAGHVIALFDIALEMLTRCGLSKRRAQAILQPLISSAVANLSSGDPAAALTGTFSRGDVATVRQHLAAIKARDLDAALAAYALLGQRSLLLNGKQGQNFAAIAALLDRAERKNKK